MEYLDYDQDLKNGYHLADILTKTCFVAGNESIFRVFKAKVIEVHLKQSDKTQQQVKKQLKEDLDNFNIAKNLMPRPEIRKTINIKRVVYRSVTLFVSALG